MITRLMRAAVSSRTRPEAVNSEKRRPSRRRGVTYLEAITSLLIFLTCVFFFIDAARYFYIRTILNYAAHVGVDLASKVELETPTAALDCPAGACEDTPCGEYLQRWRMVVDKVEELADLVSTDSNTASMAKRIAFEHYVDIDGFSPQNHDCMPPQIADVVFLRPGEVARGVKNKTVTYEIPSRPYTAAAGTPSGWPGAGESWPRVLRENPFGIRIDVEYRPITPFLRPITMHIEQYGHRLTRAVGAYLPALPTVPPTAVPTPTGTLPTPTITPGGPTLTPTMTVTGTPPTSTPTPVVTSTATPYPTYNCTCCRPVITSPCNFASCMDNCSGAG